MEITVTVGEETRVYYASTQIQVPLELITGKEADKINAPVKSDKDTENKGDSLNNQYGMITKVTADETEEKKSIQLTTPGDDERYSHYLPMFHFVKYQDNVNSFTPENGNGNNLLKLDNPEFLPYAIDLGKTDPDVVLYCFWSL